MLYELLDQLRDELFKALIQENDDDVARLERAIHVVEGQIQLDEQAKELVA